MYYLLTTTGSTLLDCILGAHPDFVSSGELHYLNWQLYRTENITPSVNAQNICTCELDFRDCPYWSRVFAVLKRKTGKDIVTDPTSFDTAYFNQFSYQDSGGFTRSFLDKVGAHVTRLWCEQGWNYKRLPFISKKIEHWLENNWLLYETMAEVAQKPIVVDSSKHLMIALLLQQYKPDDVTLVFLHRSTKGLLSSYKKLATKRGESISLMNVIKAKAIFTNRIIKYKRNVEGLRFFDVHYENIATKPAEALRDIVALVGADQNYDQQENHSFFVDPSLQHMVAGNPMRYKGRQQVAYDDRWKSKLTKKEIELADKLSNDQIQK